MIKATYLMDIEYFDTFEDLKNFYDHSEAETLEELEEILTSESDGMAIPKFECL